MGVFSEGPWDFSQGRLYHLKTMFFTYRAGISESVEKTKKELAKIRKIMKNVRKNKAFTNFDMAWV